MTDFARRALLVVDDDAGHRMMLEALLRKWGFQVTGAQDGSEAVESVRRRPFDVVLMDVRMAVMDGITALKTIRKYNPAVPVVIMTAYSDVESAVDALKSGACDYLIKPLDFDALRAALERGLEHCALKTENGESRALPDQHDGFVGVSQAIRSVRELIARVAPSEATVLISGESGTGKELVAKAIHARSSRKHNPLVVVNCAALSDHLLESELFGHERGAFTGADKRRDGRFVQADGGTLFLDEIGEIPLSMQSKLLRAIQQGEIQRVGSDTTLTADVRLVAATNRDLAAEVESGRFRADLYYRLNVVNLRVPALREHPEDIPALAEHFLRLQAARNRRRVKGFTPQAMDRLIRYAWPGNVRELENTVERAVVLLVGSYVSERELPQSLLAEPVAASAALLSAQTPTVFSSSSGRSVPPAPSATLEEVEREVILHTLEAAGGNKSEAARLLGVSRKTLHFKLKRYAEE